MSCGAREGSFLYRAKQVFLAGLLAGSIGYGVSSYVGLERRVDTLSEKIDARTGRHSGDVLEDKLVSDDGELNALDATVKIVYVKQENKKVNVLMGSGCVVSSVVNARGLYDNYVLSVAHTFEGGNPASMTPTALEYLLWINQYKSLVLANTFDAKIVAFDGELDVAVLKFQSGGPVPVVRLATGAELGGVLSDVYTVGCPLDKPPVKTDGELHGRFVNDAGKEFWLITALATYGNSGGGVFSKKSGEVIGLLTKTSVMYLELSEEGLVIEAAVPYLNLVTPVHLIRDWLVRENFSFLYER